MNSGNTKGIIIMSNARPKYEAFVSPVGTAIFPYLTKPDTRHVDSGVYHVDLSLPKELAADFTARLDRVLDNYMDTELTQTQKMTLARKPVFKPEYTFPEYPEGATDAEREEIKANHVPEETGNVLFRVKMNAQFTTKKGEIVTQQPIVVLAETGERVTDPVFMGSTIRVKGQIIPYVNAAAQTVGLSLRLKSAQVIELVSGSGGTFWTDFESESE